VKKVSKFGVLQTSALQCPRRLKPVSGTPR
jgi:hypothetical protein